MEQVSEQVWRIMAGAGGLIASLALLLLWRAWRTAVKAVDRMVSAIDNPIIMSAESPIANIKYTIYKRGVQYDDGGQDAPGRLIHERARLNDG